SLPRWQEEWTDLIWQHGTSTMNCIPDELQPVYYLLMCTYGAKYKDPVNGITDPSTFSAKDAAVFMDLLHASTWEGNTPNTSREPLEIEDLRKGCLYVWELYNRRRRAFGLSPERLQLDPRSRAAALTDMEAAAERAYIENHDPEEDG